MSTVLAASAPGSIMISGEHAVVYGAPATVCAIAPRVHIRLTTRRDRQIIIHSTLAEHRTDLDALQPHEKLRFIIAALQQAPPACGVELDISSNIDPTLGLGSSAAVAVAITALLARLRGDTCDNLALHRQAHRTILAVQQRGSGADLAASLTGGMIAYQNRPQTRISALPLPPVGISLRYAGYKTPTAEVLAHIAARATAAPQYYRNLYRRMEESSRRGIRAAEKNDWAAFYHELNAYQQLLTELGVCDQIQAAHIAAARPHAHAAKISGSGLGDCIIALAETLPAAHQQVEIASEGLRWEK